MNEVSSWRKMAIAVRTHGHYLYGHTASRRALRRWINFKGSCRFEDRSKGSENLLLVLAGYKADLWPIVLPRVVQFVPPDYDVCVVCPGKAEERLEKLCEKEGWSFLSTSANKLCLALNLAIQKHPSAKWIFKMDEDIVLSEGFFELMKMGWETMEREKRYHPGLLVPLLNVNGYSSRIFLEKRGKLAEFISRFGEARQSCTETCVWKSADAASYLWDLSSPFDEVAQEILEQGPEYSACPHRFSIGAFLLRREFWEEQQGFTVGGIGELGTDEVDVSIHCMITSQVIICAHHILVGHVGFGPQVPTMVPRLKSRPDLLLETVAL